MTKQNLSGNEKKRTLHFYTRIGWVRRRRKKSVVGIISRISGYRNFKVKRPVLKSTLG